MPEFKAYLVEGVFSEDLRVGDKDLCAYLGSMVGTRVRVAAHYVPSTPPDPTRPGAGSCMWPLGRCQQHRGAPHWMFNVVGEGVLLTTGQGRWGVEQLDGVVLDLPLGKVLPGHSARVAVASVFTVDQMRDLVEGAGLTDVVDKVSDLQELLHKLKSAGKSQ